ncbi:hypothetical protein DACRYDRAFT_117853 [Dacryopinax primogenitus]|uniref:Uncharacterized protein n=1 Tax=Dacryopinax primogenitus (strain DJM 731) TaxID=1858805 RepID=M5G1F9_DACPD|nr:uncharacterized protein DACRYDRAFT_117853 [Dacryopinax primogenitus]EJT99661.1 hypothetical protein DACRYDRAFT_117853 [Dacryopinax primogenitus]
MASEDVLSAAQIPLPGTSPEDDAYWVGSPDYRSESSTGMFCLESHRESSFDYLKDPVGKSTFYQKFKIDFKEPVGNLSISPAGRDVVLAARKGLFIIDLEQPYSSPRFLPQGGTWEVADVQWNPHPSRAELIVSTSSQKLLIWNLYLSGKSSIDQILHAHYRAITDLNWHAYEPEIIASCGIDSWIWSWDLRQGPKPAMGFCAWNASATQVKWNRQDEHLLASSHDNYVLIWDRRKGSVPLITMRAHDTKIYGIDWSRRRRNELVTCSLDKTIKFWRFDEMSRLPHAPLDNLPRSTSLEEKEFTPTGVINTGYPIWRARHLPFGHGVLSMSQRGENTLDMWSYGAPNKPVYQFEGHTNVVKEFVWRTRGGADLDHDDREFQLITWSKDHTLRGWPLDRSVLEKAGFRPGAKIKVIHSRRNAPDISFRVPPQQSPTRKITFSAPMVGRSILAGVRATPQQGNMKTPRSGSDREAVGKNGHRTKPKKATFHDGGFMTRGHTRGRPARGGLDQMTWISSVRLEKQTIVDATQVMQDSPELPESRNDSGGQSPSRASSLGKGSTRGGRSSSRELAEDRPSDIAQEMAAVAQTFSPRVKFEKIDVTARTCTISLHGPWLESDPVFLRVAFTFPSNYPRSSSLSSTPHIELEKTSTLPLRTRAYLLRHLRELRMQRRPCLGACVRFLLGMPDMDGRFGTVDLFDDDEESDDEDRGRQSAREVMARKFNLNVPTARRGGATFGPNGELVYFYAPPLRILAAERLKTSRSPSTVSRNTTVSDTARRREAEANPLSNAMAGLLRLSQTPGGKETEPVTRTITSALPAEVSQNLLASATKIRARGSGPSNDSGDRLAIQTTVISPPKVFIRDVSHIIPGDKELAKDLSCRKGDLAEMCEINIAVARKHGRPDHERIWLAFLAIVTITSERPEGSKRGTWFSATNPLAQEIVKTSLCEAESSKDVQMLGMIACLLLQSRGRKRPLQEIPSTPKFVSKPSTRAFSLKSPMEIRLQIPPPTPPHLQTSPNLNSPSPPSVPSTSSRNSSSWSSLASKLLRAATETTPPPSSASRTRTLSQETKPGSSPERAPNSIPVKSPWKASQARLTRLADRITNDATSPTGYKSHTDPVKSLASNTGRMLVTLTSEGHQSQREYSMKTSKLRPTPEHPQMTLQWHGAPRMPKSSFFTPLVVNQLEDYVRAYAELLVRWQLFQRRAELWEASFPNSKSQDVRNLVPESEESLGLEMRCQRCHRLGVVRVGGKCAICQVTFTRPKCAFCRLPVSRLDRICLLCGHCMHDQCRNLVLNRLESADKFVCPSGCGCRCDSCGLFYSHEEDTQEADITLRSASPDTTGSAMLTPRGRSVVRPAMTS